MMPGPAPRLPRPQNIAVIINPSSAGGRTLKLWPAYKEKLTAGGFTAISRVSASEADFRIQTQTFSRTFNTVAVCGGDSSLTIAAEELLRKKFSGELIFLPAGSVNDIVLDIRSQGSEKPVYLGVLKSDGMARVFIGQANWGLGVVVNRWVGKVLKALPFLRPLQNLIGTLSIILAHLLRRERVRLEIRTDNGTFAGCYSLVLVSQIRHWASGLAFAPAASYLKPEFQIITIRRCGLVRLIRIILAAQDGRHLDFAEVESRLARSIEVVSEISVSVQIDGDILRKDGKEFRAQKFAVNKKKSAFKLGLHPAWVNDRRSSGG